VKLSIQNLGDLNPIVAVNAIAVAKRQHQFRAHRPPLSKVISVLSDDPVMTVIRNVQGQTAMAAPLPQQKLGALRNVKSSSVTLPRRLVWLVWNDLRAAGAMPIRNRAPAPSFVVSAHG